MIKATELRIGNNVLKAKWLQKSYSKPDNLEYDQITVSHNDITACVIKPQHFQPIPLTPEILEKFGFTFKPTGEEVYEQIWSIGNFEIWEHDSGFCHDFHHGGDVKHLHQLQNLYFALTGEELNYTP